MIRTVIERYLSERMSGLLKNENSSMLNGITEIRLRLNKPALVYIKDTEYTLGMNGLTKVIGNGEMITAADIKKTIELMSNFSLYAWEDELKNGYITLPGGHRAGLSGKVVTEAGHVKTISHISNINLRISHEIIGCADAVMDCLGLPHIEHTMIISPPGCGKTTLLRDISRQLSNGVEGKFSGQTIGIVDERSEIAGCYLGAPQNDVGLRTDILDGCPKAQGMVMFLRSMAPKVIIVDEIGKSEDISAVEDILNAGVKLICTIHGNSLEDVLKKPGLKELISPKVFGRYIVLSNKNGPGHIENIFDEDFRQVMFTCRH